MMRKILFSILLLPFLCTLLAADNLSIRVIDKDLDIPLQGVRITDTEKGTVVLSDEEGNALLPIPDPVTRLVIKAELIGYTTRKVLVKDFSSPLLLEMLIESVIEGEELVVEEEAIGVTDEEVGVSTVIERDVIQSAAKMGIIEDVMSAVQMLPGVSYNGGFGAYLSVRGGYPEGLTAIMDGFVVKYPYHWGGGFSIFNPNIVESVKFSPGIFSTKYGQATSGIIEVHTITPNEGFRYSVVTSLSTAELFIQLPLGDQDQFGLFTGTRLTNYDLVFQLVRSTMEEGGTTFSRIPYIYDAYFKAFYRPTDRFEWYLNGFWGNDGVGIQSYDPDLDTSQEIATDFDFKYSNLDLFFNSGIKFLAGDNLLLHILGGYEYWLARVDGTDREHGSQEYSQEFWDLYSVPLGLTNNTFNIDLESNFVSDILVQNLQLRGDADLSLGERFLWQNGLGTNLDITTNSQSGTYYFIDFDSGSPEYRKSIFDTEAKDNKIFNSFIYTNLNWDLIPATLNLELGFRLDHSYLISGDDYTLNTYPVLGPRLKLRYGQQNPGGFFSKNTWSVGTGLFSKTPFNALSINKEMGLKDFDIAIPKTLTTVIGWETEIPFGIRFKIEAYYKYIYDRFYYNLVTDKATSESELFIHNDGIGHATGFDLLLDRRTSRYLDGMISYSFIYARYLNPESDEEDTDDLRGEWYYPFFHRFHTVNLMLNVKPLNWLTFTTKLSFASGAPLSEYGEKEMFPATVVNDDGSTSIAEMYTRQTFYSDSLREWISLPLDFKIAVHNYFSRSKLQWETYLAVEDVLSPILAKLGPNNTISTNRYTGNEDSAPSSDFSFIMISLGFKLSY